MDQWKDNKEVLLFQTQNICSQERSTLPQEAPLPQSWEGGGGNKGVWNMAGAS